MDIHQAMQRVGNAGCYQIRMVVFMSMLCMIIPYMLLGSSYIFINPTFVCNNKHNIIVNELEACNRISNCRCGTYISTTQWNNIQ
jgi:hypothetical protein